MLGNIIAAILIGIVAGYLGRLLLPGKDPMGFVGTVIAGIIGALVGYFLFAAIGIGDTDKFDFGGIIGAIIGTMIVLLIWRAISGRMGGGTRTDAGHPRLLARGRGGPVRARLGAVAQPLPQLREAHALVGDQRHEDGHEQHQRRDRVDLRRDRDQQQGDGRGQEPLPAEAVHVAPAEGDVREQVERRAAEQRRRDLDLQRLPRVLAASS